MDAQQLANLVAALPQATSLDLYRLEFAIRALRNEPRRILEIRRRLHLGMTVRFFNPNDGSYRNGRIVELRDRDLAIYDLQHGRRFNGLPYAALDLQSVEESEVEILDADHAAPTRKTKGHTRDDFRTGDTVSFTDRGMQVVMGRITRLNPKTATIETDSGAWRVSYALLQPVVDL